ncbi:Protein of unknown function [Soonwooa buanensis]|uniref:Uncharacterized protein n=1 Tax=Soonwooa buanensis TaxID=619805 RepID=A0A1T5CWS4_9FLAO|nr:AAA family ATPase [Soonwooa buanensis]SKB63813.1 Protein of unknown function [Soonwooa buanensis]
MSNNTISLKKINDFNDYKIDISNNLVIVGANGSGKSKLGYQLSHSIPNCKRISANRIMSIHYTVPTGNYEESLQKHIEEWKYKPIDEPFSDFITLLSTLFMQSTIRDRDYVDLCKNNVGQVQPQIPLSAIDKLSNIWKELFPHRQIKFIDNTIKCFDENLNEFSANFLSDGEKVGLYLISQCLIVPKDFHIIIDEPELHLHKALMSKLWNLIERERPDCKFIYITHDLDFAASRIYAEKIWIKEFKNHEWDWDLISKNESFSEDIIFQILGSRMPIIFCEGNKSSWDYSIYQSVYKNFTVIPIGGCDKVIESTKAINNNIHLHHRKAFGIIDKDYRSMEEINALEKDDIYCIKVAEVENLFLVPEVTEEVANHLHLDSAKLNSEISNYVISELSNNLEKEISHSTNLEINYNLNAFNIKQIGKENILKELEIHTKSIDVTSIYDKYVKIYNDIIHSKDVKVALYNYTNKGLLPNVSNLFNFKKNAFANLVIKLNNSQTSSINELMKKYLPTLEI